MNTAAVVYHRNLDNIRHDRTCGGGGTAELPFTPLSLNKNILQKSTVTAWGMPNAVLFCFRSSV